MSPSSVGSTSSWRGGGGAMLDIIDLDRYMRGHVRGAPRHSNNTNDHRAERLVVDAGGANPRKVERAPTAATGESSSSAVSQRNKRYSHDSGLSDGSYTKKRKQIRRRMSADGDRSVDSGPRSSLQNFRVHTERALKEQQEQLARVAEICERLAVRSGVGGAGGAGETDSGDSSDVTSTSSGGERRRDVRECKTYKIIMSKLDELNRLFAVRARSPVAARAPTTCSAHTYTRATTRTLMERAVGSDAEPPPPVPPPPSPHQPLLAPPVLHSAPPPVAPPVAPLSRLTPALALQVDIAPDTTRDLGPNPRHVTTRDTKYDTQHDTRRDNRHDARQRRHSGTLNVATESVLHYSPQSTSVTDTGSAGTSAEHYHLNDPLKLYAQAKRLQALQALQVQKLRAHSLESSPSPSAAHKQHLADAAVYHSSRARDHSRVSSSSLSGGSVCALCRRYWRALTRCLHALHSVT